jgi:ADP-ribosylglycohydrolase
MPEFRRGRFDETCQYCVPLAFEIFKKSSNFEDAIRRAILFGGDSDTIVAIVGTLAESYYGVPRWTTDVV